MLSTFIIALREGFEAALIVGILIAYLIRTDRASRIKPLWYGVGVATVASFAAGAVLSYTQSSLGDRAEIIFAGATSFVAAALVTWMIFWMKATAKNLRGELHGKVDQAILAGPFAVALTAFLSVVREGLETALFLYSNFNTESHPAGALTGLILGLATSILLGYLVFKSSIKLNMSKFFLITGIALIIIVGNIISYGYHEFEELGWLPESNLLRYGTAGTYIVIASYYYSRSAKKPAEKTLVHA